MSNLVFHKTRHVDDILFYVTDQLNILGVIDKPELKSITPRTSLNEYFYIKFYDAVKKYGQCEEEKYYADILHWSNQFNKSVLPLLKQKHHSVSEENNRGIILVPNDKTKIAVSALLKKYMPPKRRFPAWFFWEEHKILDFWEK